MSTGSPESLQLIFFGGAALIVLLKALHGWRVGIVRQLLGVGALLAAYLVGYFGGGVLGPVLKRFIDLPENVLAVAGAVVVGFVMYCAITFVGSIVFKKTSEQGVMIVRLGYGLSGAAVGALYGLFLVWIAILAVRLLGSVAETQIAVAKNQHLTLGKATPSPTPVPTPPSAVVRGLAQMKHSLESGAAGAVVQQVDPIPGTLYGILRKLGVMVSDEKSVNRFLSYPGVQPLLAHPKVAALQSDHEITIDIIERRYLKLIGNPRIIAAANDAEIGELMRKFEFEKALDYAIRPPEPRK